MQRFHLEQKFWTDQVKDLIHFRHVSVQQRMQIFQFSQRISLEQSFQPHLVPKYGLICFHHLSVNIQMQMLYLNNKNFVELDIHILVFKYHIKNTSIATYMHGKSLCYDDLENMNANYFFIYSE